MNKQRKGMRAPNILLLCCVSLLAGAFIFSKTGTIYYILGIIFVLFFIYIFLEANPTVEARLTNFISRRDLSDPEVAEEVLNKLKAKKKIRLARLEAKEEEKRLKREYRDTKPSKRELRAQNRVEELKAKQKEEEEIIDERRGEREKFDNKYNASQALEKEKEKDEKEENKRKEDTTSVILNKASETISENKQYEDLDITLKEKYNKIHGDDYPTNWDGFITIDDRGREKKIPMPISKDGRAFCATMRTIPQDIITELLHPNEIVKLQEFEDQHDHEMDLIIDEIERLRSLEK